jgi:hypothetical protein
LDDEQSGATFITFVKIHSYKMNIILRYSAKNLKRN